MRSTVALGVLGLLVSAGCVTPAAIVPAPSAAAPVANAPAVSSESILEAPLTREAPEEKAPYSATVHGDAPQDLHVRVLKAHAGAAGGARLALPEAHPQNATLVVTWESRTPLDAAVDIWLHERDVGTVAWAHGTSPLVVEIDGESFGHGVKYYGWVEPSTVGAIYESSVHFALHVTYD